jgi:hypothetical protein
VLSVSWGHVAVDPSSPATPRHRLSEHGLGCSCTAAANLCSAASRQQGNTDGDWWGVAQEASFKEFCDRPENKPMLIKHQQSEVRKAMRLNRKMKAMVRASLCCAVHPLNHLLGVNHAHAACEWLLARWQTQDRSALSRGWRRVEGLGEVTGFALVCAASRLIQWCALGLLRAKVVALPCPRAVK